MFSIPVLIDKDGWDITIAVTTILSVIISAASIWFIYWCSAIRADKIKKENEEKYLLDYMLIVVHRYLSYMFQLRDTLYAKFNNLESFIEDPSNIEKRKHAFATIAVLQILDIELAKYDFTIKTQPSIIDDIIHFQHIYQHIITGVNHINNTSNRCIPIGMPQEIVIETAKELITENRSLYALDVMISTSAVILGRIFENINRYKINNKHRDHLGMILTDEEKLTIKEMKNFLEEGNHTEWQQYLNDLV